MIAINMKYAFLGESGMRKRSIVVALAAMILLGLPGGVQATVIDLFTQFPENQGDNGFYVYAYVTKQTQ